MVRQRIQRGDTSEVRFIRGRYLQDWLLKPDDDNWRLEGEAPPELLRRGIGVEATVTLEMVVGQKFKRYDSPKLLP